MEAYGTENANSARAQSSKAITRPSIAQRIAELREQVLEKTAADADQVIKETEAVAMSDITQILRFADGFVQINSSDELPEAVKKGIASVKRTEHTTTQKDGTEVRRVTVEIKMHNKVSALELLSKQLNLTSDWNQVLAGARKFGLTIYQDEKGKWQIENVGTPT